MKQDRATRTRRRLDPATWAEFCAAVLPVGEGVIPESVVGWHDRRGAWKRIEARYPNGHRLYFSFDAAGGVVDPEVRMKFTIAGDA